MERERACASVRKVASAFAPQRGRVPARLQALERLQESLGMRLRVALRLGMRRPCPRFCGVSVFDSSLSFLTGSVAVSGTRSKPSGWVNDFATCRKRLVQTYACSGRLLR